MWIYVYPNNTETEITNLYIGIPFPESITLDKNSIAMDTVGQTEQLTATLSPTPCDQSITWSSDDTTIATVSTSWLVTCVTPWECTITATTVNGLTATCGVTDQSWWQPWANTILYMPLDSTNTVNDLSSNSNNWTISWTVTFWTNLWVDCGAFLNSGYITIPYSSSMNTTNITISCWCAIASGYGSNNWWIIAKTALSNWHWPYHIANLSNFRFSINRDALSMDEAMFNWNNQWVYITCDYNGTTAHVYKNGVLIDSDSYTYDISWDTNPLVLWAYYSSNYKMNWFLSRVIIENKIRTAQEVADYYNQTKSLYGIS